MSDDLSDLSDLRDIEQLLRQAEAKLETVGSFRQRTLLQMTLFEIRRCLSASGRNRSEATATEPKREEYRR